jgi:phosphate ABC transporter phosphate-binding protein
LTWVFRLPSALSTLLVLLSASARICPAQDTVQLSQIKKLYVDSLGNDKRASAIREQMVERLRKSHEVQVVSDPRQADAVMKGTGRIWTTSHVTLSPRSNSLRQSTFEGFLSVELVSKSSETLWSYLVSPSKFPWNGIADDLARQLVSKLLAALKRQEQPASDVAGATPHLEATLRGAGATFPAPLYQRWFELFADSHPNVHISYDAVGSTEGIERLREQKADFAGSEMPLSDEAMFETHQRLLHLPAVLGAVVPIYNVKGVRQNLNFTSETLSGIFLGKIRKWNDPEIRKSNRGATLPDEDIVVVHRSEGSGTSFVWTDYLSKVSPQWKAAVGAGASVAWPVGVGAERNEGVASAVEQTANSIGYVEFIYAIQHELSFAAVRNSAGEFIKASISSVSAAAATAAQSQSGGVVCRSPMQAARMPIRSPADTWLLLPEEIADKTRRDALTELLGWMLTSGQRECSALGYAPLPAEVAKRALESFTATK